MVDHITKVDAKMATTRIKHRVSNRIELQDEVNEAVEDAKLDSTDMFDLSVNVMEAITMFITVGRTY